MVIAHRGASGYLPEHTLAAKALAHGMGADFLEQDVVATSDGQLIVFHDLYLDQMTDVATRYPGRARADGLHYCLDFTLPELRVLRVTERRRKGSTTARFPGRFPADTGSFGIHTFEEELDLIRGLNRSTGRTAGVYAEIKEPEWHASQGVNPGDRMIEILRSVGYRTPEDGFYIQCFSSDELRRVRARFGAELPLIQLLDWGAPTSRQDLTNIASYAQGIGPATELLLADRSIVRTARQLGLLVHAFTFRADDLPAGFANFDELLVTFIQSLEIDGLFTDFPDLVVRHLNQPLAVQGQR